MNPDRWERIKELFTAVSARPAGHRRRFLADACAGDEELCQDVQALLDQAVSTGAFNLFEGDPREVGGPFAATVPLVGQRLGVYEVQGLLGSGGMGEVYRARDTKLGRDVAIKVLPPAFIADPARLARFEREARVVAALNHPNVAAIHGVEESNGVRALVLELVEGDTLAERLAAVAGSARRGLRVDEALHYARQIAAALEAAHEKGITHRDLKPANIKITPDGQVKLLDFGIAKVVAGDGPGVDLTQAFAAGTVEGVIVGTPAYMSPEQARGKPVDKRTDIWAFGCVLYEMLTVRTAFGRDTVSDTIAAVLESQPDWDSLPTDTPPSVRRILERCLAKDSRERLRDIGDARLDLDEAVRGSGPEDRAPQPTAGVTRRISLIAAVLVIAALAAGILIARRLMPGEPTRTVDVRRLTDFAGLEEFPAISPDGKSVSFVADVGRNRAVFVRLLAGGPALQITRDARNPQYPRWSPDSAAILYYLPPSEGEMQLQGAIWEVSALGGASRRIVSALSTGDISHDGRQLAFFDFDRGTVRLMVSTRDGANMKAVAELDGAWSYLMPRWSPDDASLAYQRGNANTHGAFIVSARGGEPRQVIRNSGLLSGVAWLPDGSALVFSSSRGATVLYLPTFNLWTIGVNGEGLRQFTFGETSYLDPDSNQAGSIVASRVRMQFDIWKYPSDGLAAENTRRGVRVTRQTGQVQTPSAAPTGDHIVYLSDSGGHGNLWITQLSTGEARQISFEQDPAVVMGVPVWSPAGDQIAFWTAPPNYRQGGYSVIRPDGSNLRRLVPEGGWGAWSHDGRWFYHTARPGLAGENRLEKVDIARGDVAVVRPENASSPAPAPDGRTLYFSTQVPAVAGSFDVEVRVASPEDAASRVLTRIPSHRLPAWQRLQFVLSPDGRWLAVPLTDGATTNVWAISTTDGSFRQITDFGHRPTFIVRRVSWSADGRSVFAAVGEGDADVVLLAESKR